MKRILCLLITALLIQGCEPRKNPDSGFEVAARGAHTGAISDDGRFLVVGSVEHGGSLWRIADNERLFNWNHENGNFTTLVAADFSPDNQWALTASATTLVLWNTQQGDAPRFWTSPSKVTSVQLSRNASFALLGLDAHMAVIFDVQRGGVLRRFHHDARVNSVSLSDDGRLALTGADDHMARLWDIQSGKLLQEFKHQDNVNVVALSPDGTIAFSSAQYDRAILWDTRSGKVVNQIPLNAEQVKRGLKINSARFSPNGRELLTARPDQTLQLWDTQSMALLQAWEIPKRKTLQPTGTNAVALGFAPLAGNYFALASNGLLQRLSR